MTGSSHPPISLTLDAERPDGEFVLRVTERAIQEVAGARTRYAGILWVEAEPYNVLSQRPFELFSLQVSMEDRTALCGSYVHVVRGRMDVVVVYTGELLDAPFPTRVLNPPRQNLSIRVADPECPMEIRCMWRHVDRITE